MTIVSRLAIGLGLLAAATAQLRAQVVGQRAEPAAQPLIRAHAHNDYDHPRPLLDALDHGFCSVEADIFLVDGQLLVGHTSLELKPQRTLQALYLDPLRLRIRDNGGRVYHNGPPLTLMIDVKTDAGRTYAVGIDGRLGDLDTQRPSHLMPLISDNWRSHFRWRGRGPMPEQEREKLRAIVEKAHAKGRRVRFWATPDDPAVWRELVDAGVDLLNADDLAGLERFLRSQNSKEQ